MSDPKRMLESGGSATPRERELLAREIATGPSRKLEDAVWQRVLAALPPIGPGSPDNGGGGGDWGAGGAGAGGTGIAGATSGGASAASAGSALAGLAKTTGLGVAKALGVGMFAGAVAVTGVAEIGDRMATAPVSSAEARLEGSAEHGIVEPPTPRLRSSPAVAASPAPAPVAPRRVPVRGEEAALPPIVTGSSSARFELPGGDLASRTRAERLALEQARRALRSGDPATALAVVGRAQQSGVLAQEREVLAIEALSAAGRGSEAHARARAFLNRFPGSPHQNHVREFAR
jgi:hypothetical protein